MRYVFDFRKQGPYLVRWVLLLVLFFSPHILWWFVNRDMPSSLVRAVRIGTESLLVLMLPLILFRFRICVRLFWLVVVTYPFELGHIYLYHSFFTTGTMRSVLASNVGESSELLLSMIPVVLTLAAVPVAYYFLTRNPLPDMNKTRGKWWWLALPLLMMVSSEGVDYLRSRSSYTFMTNTAMVLGNTPPVNFFATFVRARIMERNMAAQQATYKDFSYGARSLRDSTVSQTYVVVIGESARYGNFGLNGYVRNTTPLLTKRGDVMAFRDFYSTANVTLYSIPLMLTRFGVDDFDKVYSEKSLVSAFKEAGFATYWVSNQGMLSDPNAAFIMDIDKLYDFSGYRDHIYDEVVLPCVDEILRGSARKKCIFINLMGNHVAYNARHPREYNVFRPSLSDGSKAAIASNREYFVNSYDNSVLYQDFILSQIISKVDSAASSVASAALPVESFVLYFGDHGESLFDAGSDVFGHTGNPPLREQIHIPFFVWLSPLYRQMNPGKVSALEGHVSVPLSMDHLFYTLLDMAQIAHRFEDRTMSFADSSLVVPTIRKVVAPSGAVVTF